MISVIIPTYQSKPDILSRALKSVLSQTYNDIEVLIIDDGSEIPFSGINKDFNDGRIKWIAIGHNSGVAKARNIGIENARGEYIAFLDSDDWWHEDKLMQQYELISKGARWVYCGITVCLPDNNSCITLPEKRGSVHKDLLMNQYITGSSSSVLLERKLLDEVGGFDDHNDLVEDWDLWIRISKVASVEYVNSSLVFISAYNYKSRSSGIHGRAKRLQKLIDKHIAELRVHGMEKFAKGRMNVVIGRRYLVQGYALYGIKHWLISLIYCPRLFPWKWLPVALLSFLFPTLYRRLHIYRRFKV